MKDNEFKALISLLDDEDPQVFTHVWDKLTSLGSEGVERLESEWEVQHDPRIQEMLVQVIDSIMDGELTQELRDWRLGGGKDLFEGWQILTKFLNRDVDLERYRALVNRLVHKTWLGTENKLEPHEKMRVINHILFHLEEFKSEKRDQHTPELNFLSPVMDEHRGNVISLSMLYLVICKKLNYPVSGVIMPGYFFLHYIDSHLEFYIDVYNGGLLYSKQDLQNFVKASNLEVGNSQFKPTSNTYIMLYLIRNLIEDYKKSGLPKKAERFEKLLDDIDVRLS